MITNNHVLLTTFSHIAGLLAYFISLQPKTSSGYAATAMTPAKLKKSMVNIASSGVLSGIPSDTVNLLAWNGGGSGNLSDIFDGESRYKAPKQQIELDKLLHDVKDIAGEMTEETAIFLNKFEGMILDDVKAAFENAKQALAHSHE